LDRWRIAPWVGEGCETCAGGRRETLIPFVEKQRKNKENKSAGGDFRSYLSVLCHTEYRRISKKYEENNGGISWEIVHRYLGYP
jgi:hypothetical protein